MASTLKNFDFPETHSRQSHPWETYIDGKIRRLKAGDDFQGDAGNFASLCRSKAKELGIEAKTAVEYEGEGDDKKAVSVVVQFLTKKGEAPDYEKLLKAKKKKDKKAKSKAKASSKEAEESEGSDEEDEDF